MKPVKVFLCGGSGSGKTVMLASLFKALSVRDKRLNMRCETSATAAGLLRFIHSNLTRKWPNGTELDALYEIPFNFYVDNDIQQSYHAASVIFYDYAGRTVDPEEITDAVSIRLEKMKALVDECNVVMCVLDGSLIYESIYENNGEPVPELERMVNAALGFWLDGKSRNLDGRKNNYFIITKWDLFEDGDDVLLKVRDFLLGMYDVESYLEMQKHSETIVRVIPVSAVGSGYAKRVPGTRDMEIVAKRPSDPINIDVPLAALIPDLVNAALAREKATLNQEAWEISQQKAPWWKRALNAIGTTISGSIEIRRFLNDMGLNPHHIERISEAMKNQHAQTEEQKRKALADIVAKARSNEDAAAIVHNHFGQVVANFDEKYPSSFTR